MKIALVDPMATLAQLAVSALSDAGHTVTEIAAGPENVSEVRHSCRTSDAVAYLPTGWSLEAAAHEQHWIDSLLAALEGTGKRLLYLSDASVIGPTSQWHQGSEDSGMSEQAAHPWRVRNEQRVLTALVQGVRTVVIRPALLYGHRAGPLVDRLCSYAEQSGQAFYVADGSARTSTVHIDDLVDLIVAAIERAPQGSRYFAAAAEVVTWRQVAETVARAAGSDCLLTSLAPDVATAAGLDTGIMTLDSVIDDAAPRRRLSWHASHPPLTDGDL